MRGKKMREDEGEEDERREGRGREGRGRVEEREVRAWDNSSGVGIRLSHLT